MSCKKILPNDTSCISDIKRKRNMSFIEYIFWEKLLFCLQNFILAKNIKIMQKCNMTMRKPLMPIVSLFFQN